MARLFIAVGASFHRWKFLPTIGAHVARLVRGEFEERSEEKKRLGWKRSLGECVFVVLPETRSWRPMKGVEESFEHNENGERCSCLKLLKTRH